MVLIRLRKVSDVDSASLPPHSAVRHSSHHISHLSMMLCRLCSRALLRSSNPSSSLPSTRRYASGAHKPLKLAIIGAGPSGFYAASRILSSIPADSPNGRHVQVDMYERLPTPYGLARYGVAPDHPEVKVGTDALLLAYYHAEARTASTSSMNWPTTPASPSSGTFQSARSPPPPHRRLPLRRHFPHTPIRTPYTSL